MVARLLIVPLLVAAVLMALTDKSPQQVVLRAQKAQRAVPSASVRGVASAPVRSGSPAPVPTVIIGIPGLRWDDVTSAGTPHLWRLTESGDAANMSTRTATSRTCPADGWLTLSAGQRATLDGRDHRACAEPPGPAIDGTAASIRGFAAIKDVNRRGKYGASIGLLGTAVHRAGGRVLAVGAGAALAAADDTGRVGTYYPSPQTVPPFAWAASTLVLVDIEELERAQSGRAAAVRSADERLGRVLPLLPAGATILVAGVSDTGADAAALHVALAAGSKARTGWLTSSSTRRQGLVTLTDLTATALADLHISKPPKGMVGRPLRPSAGTAGVASLRDANRAALVYGDLLGPFWLVFIFGQLAMYVIAAFVLRSRRSAGAWRRRTAAATRLGALAAAAFPVASYLVNLVPWWRSAHPAVVIIIGCAVADVLVVTAALAGPWRRDILMPTTIVAGITAVMYGADVMTGSRLQLNSVAGYSAIVAGRFYGFGNVAFAVFATSVLVAAAGIAHVLSERSGAGGPAKRARARAMVVIGGIGAVAVIITAWPDWGAKVGGTIAFVPGIAVAALVATGRRVSAARLAAFAAAGVAVIAVFAVADYQRAAGRRTHLGDFVGQVLHGGAWGVIRRKFDAMIGTSGIWPLTLLALAALLAAWLLLVRGVVRGLRAPELVRAYERAPMLRAGLAGAGVTTAVGFFVEDSGIVLPGVGLAFAVPLALVAVLLEQRSPAAPVSGNVGDLTHH